MVRPMAPARAHGLAPWSGPWWLSFSSMLQVYLRGGDPPSPPPVQVNFYLRGGGSPPLPPHLLQVQVAEILYSSAARAFDAKISQHRWRLVSKIAQFLRAKLAQRLAT